MSADEKPIVEVDVTAQWRFSHDDMSRVMRAINTAIAGVAGWPLDVPSSDIPELPQLTEAYRRVQGGHLLPLRVRVFADGRLEIAIK